MHRVKIEGVAGFAGLLSDGTDSFLRPRKVISGCFEPLLLSRRVRGTATLFYTGMKF